MRDEKEGRKKQARSNKQQGKATQHTQGSHFSKKNELPQVGLEPTTLYTCICVFSLMGMCVCLCINIHVHVCGFLANP